MPPNSDNSGVVSNNSIINSSNNKYIASMFGNRTQLEIAPADSSATPGTMTPTGGVATPTSLSPPRPQHQFKIDHTLIQSQVIKVAIRLRPLQSPQDTPEDAGASSTTLNTSSHSKKSKSSSDKRAWTIQRNGATDTFIQSGAVRKVEGRSVFSFDQIFDEDTKTPLLYKSLARPMVKTVISGRHGTIFAYGNTGTGKTFTMQGDGKAASGQAGIIQLVASDLFRFMRQGAAMKREFTVRISYIEIYNEKIRDLLYEDSSAEGDGSASSEVTIRTGKDGLIAVNCVQKEVGNVDEVLEVLIAGNKHRVVAETNKNTHSSRSHALFRLNVESRGSNAGAGATELIRKSHFNLVDLAGSESLKNSGTNTTRQKEGININQSLMSLSSVIHNLSLPEKKRPKHINYRDSKLTRILQPHLSGNAEMAIICCASAAKSSLEQTRSTLRFAHRAKLVEMKPQVNEVADDGALIKKLQAELAEAKRALEEMKENSVMTQPTLPPSSSSVSDSDDEVSNPAARRYIMPKDQQSNPFSKQLQKGGPSRLYVMPQDQAIPQESSFQKFVTNHKGADGNASSANFQLDNVNPGAGRKAVFRYMEDGQSDDSSDMDIAQNPRFHSSADEELSEIGNVSGSFDGLIPKQPLDSMDFPIPRNEKRMDRTGTTAGMEDDSFNGGAAVGSYADVSMHYGDSVVSAPESIQAATRPKSRTGTVESGNFALSEPGGNDSVSWDTVKLKAPNKALIGTPLQALRNLDNNDAPIPPEVTIIRDSTVLGKVDACLTDQLADAESRSKFFERKVEAADDLVEALFKDLERARLCIHDLVHRNVTLAADAKDARREETKLEYQAGEVVMEQYWLLKGSMYASLFFFLTGGYELFTATVILIWLIMESAIIKPHDVDFTE